MMVFNFSGNVSAASLHVELLVGYFIRAEYTTDLPQAAIVERAHVILKLFASTRARHDQGVI